MENSLKRKHSLGEPTHNKKHKKETISPFLPQDTLILISKYFDIISLVQAIQVNKHWNQLKGVNSLWEDVYQNSLAIWESDVLESGWEEQFKERELNLFRIFGEPLYSGTGAYQDLLLKDQQQITGGDSIFDHDDDYKSFLPFQLPISHALPITEEANPSILDNYYFYPPTPYAPLSSYEKCKRLFEKKKGPMVQFAYEVMNWFGGDVTMQNFLQRLQPVLIPGDLVATLVKLFEKGKVWARLVFFTMESILLSRDVFSVICVEDPPLENEEFLTVDETFINYKELFQQFGQFYVSLRRFSIQKIVKTYNILHEKFFKDHPYTMLGYSLLLCSDCLGGVDHWSNNMGVMESEKFEDDEQLPLRIALSRGIQRIFFRGGIVKAEPDATEMGITILKDFLKSVIGDAIKIHDLVHPEEGEEKGKDITGEEILAALEIGGKYQGAYGPGLRLPQVLYGLSGNEEDEEGEYIPKNIEIPPTPVQTPTEQQIEQISEEREQTEETLVGLLFTGAPCDDNYGPHGEYEEELEEVVNFLKKTNWTPENPCIVDQSLYGKLLEVSRQVHEKYKKPLFDPTSPEDINNNLPFFAKNWLLCTGNTEKWIPLAKHSETMDTDEMDEESKLKQMEKEEMSYFGEIMYDKQDKKILTEEDRFVEEMRRRSCEVLKEHFEKNRIESILQKHFPYVPLSVLSKFKHYSLIEKQETCTISNEEADNKDLVVDKESFRDLCYFLLVCEGYNEVENSAMNILQRAGEEFIKLFFKETNSLCDNSLFVNVSDGDCCSRRRIGKDFL